MSQELVALWESRNGRYPNGPPRSSTEQLDAALARARANTPRLPSTPPPTPKPVTPTVTATEPAKPARERAGRPRSEDVAAERDAFESMCFAMKGQPIAVAAIAPVILRR